MNRQIEEPPEFGHYDILTANCPGRLIEEVEFFVERGWRPLEGGFCVHVIEEDNTEEYYYQVMVRGI